MRYVGQMASSALFYFSAVSDLLLYKSSDVKKESAGDTGMASNRKFFSTPTTDVYHIDYDSLLPGQWLRTNVLAYGFERLSAAAHAALELQACTSGSSNVRGQSSASHSHPSTSRLPFFVVDPSVAQAIVAFHSAELGPVAEMLAADVLIVPVADYASGSFTGNGSHWSVLVVVNTAAATDGDLSVQSDRRSPSGRKGSCIAAVHCDSRSNANRLHAEGLLALLRQWQPGRFTPAGGLQACPWLPQQGNSYDCGAFAIMAVRHVLDSVLLAAGKASLASDPIAAAADTPTHWAVPLAAMLCGGTPPVDDARWDARQLRLELRGAMEAAAQRHPRT
jgi:hypothetical protein